VHLLEIEPLDLGSDVRAMGLELTEADENREPIRGADAAKTWSRVLLAIAAPENWALDFFSHLDRLRDYCQRHEITYRDATVFRPKPLEFAQEARSPKAIQLWKANSPVAA
jgi:hypothetical protein